jgi:hypothetical protein
MGDHDPLGYSADLGQFVFFGGSLEIQEKGHVIKKTMNY